jgi:hypothetical protein
LSASQRSKWPSWLGLNADVSPIDRAGVVSWLMWIVPA